MKRVIVVPRAVVAAGAVLALAVCSDGVQPAPRSQAPPAVAARMAPVSCAEVPYDITAPGGATQVTAARPAKVGLQLWRGRGDFVVDTLRIEVLPPGSRVTPSADVPNPFANRHENAVRRLESNGFAATDREFAIQFDGRRDDGAPLPPGQYPVVYWLASSARPGGPCEGPPAAAYGVLTTIDWRG